MKIHPRTLIVAEATAEFTRLFVALEEKYDLTFGEMYALLGEKITRLARDDIRQERHTDDPDKKGGEA